MNFHPSNFYSSKNLKKLMAIPLVMLLIGIVLSRGIILDTSLSGGISIAFASNTTVNVSQVTHVIGAKLNIPFSLITINPGGGGFTIPANTSIANAETYLTTFFAYKTNYTTYSFNVTEMQVQLARQPDNQTVISQLATLSQSANASILGMASSLGSELNALSPIIGHVGFDNTSADNMSAVASAAYLEASDAYKQKVTAVVSAAAPGVPYSYEEITPTLGRYFLQQVTSIIIAAFILISIAVFFIFRSPVPALMIIFDTGNDIIIALGLMGLFKIPLGLPSLGGLLMLIGYSIDTEMLTSINILKRHEGTPEDRAFSAMLTGVTMTSAAIVSFGVLFAVSVVASVPTFYEISSVALFGLIGDLFTTWFGNAPMILLYKRHKERRI